MIADLSISDFQKFIDFFATKVPTKIVIYNSCFAGGVNKEKAFNESVRSFQRQKTYPFPIITLSSSEAVTTSSSAYPTYFNQLFEDIASTNYTLPNYYDILEKAQVFIRSGGIELTNFPQIRLPGTDFFSIEALNTLKKNEDYLIISKTMGQTRENELKVNPETKIVFVYSPIIPFTLIIPTSKKLQRIMWMGPDFYHFKTINAPTLSFQQFFSLCAPLSAQKKITCSIDLLHLKEGTFLNGILEMTPNPTKTELSIDFSGTAQTTKAATKVSVLIPEKDLYEQIVPVKKVETTAPYDITVPEALTAQSIGQQLSDIFKRR
jgi:hypothetical protein